VCCHRNQVDTNPLNSYPGEEGRTRKLCAIRAYIHSVNIFINWSGFREIHGLFGCLWSSGQSPWLQIQRSGFDSRRYQTFWEVVGLERGPLSLVSTTEELLGRKSCGSGLEKREYGRRDPSRSPRGTLYPQKLSLTSPTSGVRSVGIFRSWRPIGL
jgi:hypothetical protein